MEITVNGYEEGYKAGIKRGMVISRPKGSKPANGPDAIEWNAQYAIYFELKRELEGLSSD